MKSFRELKEDKPLTWNYAIKELDGYHALVEEYHGGGIDGEYTEVLNGGETRSDIVYTLQLMIIDTFTDEEKRKLDEMFSFRKEVKALLKKV